MNRNKLTNQKQKLPVVAMFVNDRDKMSNPYREPSIDASYQVCFRFVNFKKSSSVKLLCQNEQKFGGKHQWNVLYKVSSKQNAR
jgi:hypothetical protein